MHRQAVRRARDQGHPGQAGPELPDGVGGGEGAAGARVGVCEQAQSAGQDSVSSPVVDFEALVIGLVSFVFVHSGASPQL